jgi:hypothetical protein
LKRRSEMPIHLALRYSAGMVATLLSGPNFED